MVGGGGGGWGRFEERANRDIFPIFYKIMICWCSH